MTNLTDDEHRDAARAGQAETELRATEEAFNLVRAGLLETIAKSGFEEGSLREKCYLAVFSLEAARQLLMVAASSTPVVEYSGLIRDILDSKDRPAG